MIRFLIVPNMYYLSMINSKNIAWVCNANNRQDLRVQQCIIKNNLDIHAPYETNIYSSHHNATPDILEIIITKIKIFLFMKLLGIPVWDSDPIK